MRQTLAKVASIDAVGSFVRIRFVAPDIAPAIEPGRAVLARSTHTYLRRTWWPCAIDAHGFSVLVAGAEPDSSARIGDRVDVLGPIGRGFQVNDVCRNLLLVAAGSTAPEPDIGPLLALVDPALASGRSVTLAQAAPSDDRAYPVLALPPAIEVIRAIEADVVDRLDDALAWADQVFACGPRDFTARLADRVDSIRMRVPRGFVQALNPIVLPCGVGACGACRDGLRLACVDGPVFELTVRPRKPA